MTKKPVKMFWSGGRTRFINYGDCLGPVLVEILSGRPVVCAGTHSCELIAAGSILDRYARNRWRRTATLNFAPIKVWGTGSMHASGDETLGHIKIISVRGPGTIERFGLPHTTPTGDPGILAHILLRHGNTTKRARWGIIPHIADRDAPEIARLSNGDGVCVIDLSHPDLTVVTEAIAGCDFIASSSLHGLIAADALGIPNIRIIASDKIKGGDWKFTDYASSLDRKLITLHADKIDNLRELETSIDMTYVGRIGKLQEATMSAFRQLDL